MSANVNNPNLDKRDDRPAAIGQVWWASLAMFVICIPLCAVLKTASLPFLVIGAAVLATMFLWKTEPPKNSEAEQEAEALRAKIRDLEERLANVEVINSFEERLAERTLAREEGEQKSVRKEILYDISSAQPPSRAASPRNL